MRGVGSSQPGGCHAQANRAHACHPGGIRRAPFAPRGAGGPGGCRWRARGYRGDDEADQGRGQHHEQGDGQDGELRRPVQDGAGQVRPGPRGNRHERVEPGGYLVAAARDAREVHADVRRERVEGRDGCARVLGARCSCALSRAVLRAGAGPHVLQRVHGGGEPCGGGVRRVRGE